MSSEESLGVLDVLGNSAGFIRRADAGYIPGKKDVYVGPKIIRKFGLRTGDVICGQVGKKQGGASTPLRARSMNWICTVGGRSAGLELDRSEDTS